MDPIIVSIFILTYNQEEFIGQTIQSILAQETNFRYQLVIGEDCSTDNTRKICERYADEYIEKIRLLPTEKNHGLIQNFIRTYKECHGKYVAICDGDDFWTDPLKLQKQVDFLENNPDYGIIFTSFKFLFPDGRLIEKDYKSQKETSTFQDLILGNYISSVTAVFRNKKTLSDFPDWLETCPYGDWPLYLWTTKDGAKIKYLDDVTAVYRREIGVSEKMKLVPSRIALENLKILENVKDDIHFARYEQEIKKSLNAHRNQLLACNLRELRIISSFKLTLQTARETPSEVLQIYLYLIKRKLYPYFKRIQRYSKENFSQILLQNRIYNEMVFRNIYKKDLFNKVSIEDRSESRSGPGSSLTQTKELISKLPPLLKKYEVRSMLDIPCGDFYWMQKVQLDNVEYMGADIVPEIIKNNQQYQSNHVSFKRMDILNDELPKVDLIFCRDLFVHLTYEQIFRALKNIKDSGSKYLLTTSYKCRTHNRDIKEIGRWRALNLEISPFFIDQPVEEIFENCTEWNSQYNDKYLLLYEVQNLN